MVEFGQGSIGVPGRRDAFGWSNGLRRHGAIDKAVQIVVAALLAAGLIVSPVEAVGSAGYAVVGNKILRTDGSQFIPYGFVVECLSFSMPISKLCRGQDPNGNNQPGWALVAAAASHWNANTIRFQVSQESLFATPGSSDICGPVNSAYQTLMDGLVNQANSLGMVAIVTLQEINQSRQPGPTSSSTTFWRWMACHYASNPKVMFDLFNEPYPLGTFPTRLQTWTTWRNGQGSYVGMQSLVKTIRAAGASNVVIAQGPDHDQDLSLVMSHLLAGGSIAYGFEPNLDSNGIADGSGDDRTIAKQYIRFGQFASQIPLVPEAFIDYYGSDHCDPNSPTDLPVLEYYLDYVLHLGMISYSLDPGQDAQYNALGTPTSYAGWGTAPWSASLCPSHPTTHHPKTTFGPGSDILFDFRQSVKQ